MAVIRALKALCFAACVLQAVANPFPSPASGFNASTTLFVVDRSSLSHDMQVVTASIAGLLARDKPRVFMVNSDSSKFFTNQIAQHLHDVFNVALNTTFMDGSSWTAFLTLWRGEIDGYVLGNSATTSINAAASICAGDARRFIIGTPSTQHYLAAAGIPFAVDATAMTPTEVVKDGTYSQGLSTSVSVVQAPEKAPFVTDYAIFARALHWWATDYTTGIAGHVYGGMLKPNAVTLGWGASEFGLVRQASAAGGSVVASDWALNLATLAGFHLPPMSPPGAPTDPRSLPTKRVHTVAFSFTDGDNMQWLLSDTGFTTERWYGAPERGTVPLGWTMAPSLAALAPSVLHALYANASAAAPVCRLTAGHTTATTTPCPGGGGDDFVMSVSGAGYMYPDDFKASASTAYAAETAELAARAGLRTANVLMDGVGDWGRDLAGLASSAQVDGLLVYQGDCYRGPQGRVEFVEGKPVVGARFALWSPEASNVTTLASQLLAMPRDATQADGYSLVAVHVWSHDTADVAAVVARLSESLAREDAANGGIDIVTPSELLRRVADNLPQV